MKKEFFINSEHPETRTLALALRCLPPENADGKVSKIVEEAMELLRRRYYTLHSLSFSLLDLDEKIMENRLTNLASEYIADHPKAKKNKLLKWLIGDKDHAVGHYILTPQEERSLIAAIKDSVPYAIDMSLTFLALKAVPVIRSFMYKIDSSNSEDIEAACYEGLFKAIMDFDLETYPMGLAYKIVKPYMRNLVQEELGQHFDTTLHRRQMQNYHRLHTLMADSYFAALPLEKRAKIAGVPVDLVLLYDADNPDTPPSHLRKAAISGDIDYSSKYDAFEDFSSIHSDMDFSLIEDADYLIRTMQDPMIQNCLEALRLVFTKYKKESSKIRHSQIALTSIQKKHKDSLVSWNEIMNEVSFCAYFLARNTDYFKS